jgi:hypothetical protein
MTTYNAKDLIEQAAMMADLQNSDFISWKENMMFLDNAWTDLYQQIINHGDKTFIKSFTFSGDRVELPDDFYQLNYVCYSAGLNRIPINRKAKTSTGNGPFYDLVGNELVIYNKINSMQNVEVDYFPTRDSITFAADDQKIDKIEGQIIDVCDKKVLVYLNSTETIIDIIDGTTETTENAFMLCDSGPIVGYGEGYEKRPYFKKDNKAYYTIHENGVLTIYKYNGVVYKRIEASVVPNFRDGQVNGMTSKGLYWVENGVLKYWDFETKATTNYATGLINTNVYSFNDCIYYETQDGIWVNDELLISSDKYTMFNGVMKVDLKTGYGILVDNEIIKSAFTDTELDYPNNFYFNYLAYKLAVYYLIKQHQDFGGLVALANDALKTFYDTLPKDENEYVRISNVYAR